MFSRSSFDLVFRVAIGIWPALAVILIYILLQLFAHSSSDFNSSHWPSAFDLGACLQGGKSKNCQEIASLDNTIRMISFCAAILPVLNYFDHAKAVLGVNRRLYTQGNSWGQNASSFALSLMAIVLLLNALWIFSILYVKFKAESSNEEISTILMFCLLAFVDLTLMIIHISDKSDEGRLERDYFLGSLLFIDLPTLAGILGTMEILRPAVSANFGPIRLPIVQALFGESIVMHIALAQIALVILHIQRDVRRRLSERPVHSPTPGASPIAAQASAS